MTRKSISTNAPVVNCDVCGRTLLPGETPDVFLAGGAKRNVCELCTQRASHEGWIREGLDGATVRRAHNGRSRSLFSRLRGRRDSGAAQEEGAHEAQLAHAVALASGREVGLGSLALQDGAAADVAGDVLVHRAKLLPHRLDASGG